MQDRDSLEAQRKASKPRRCGCGGTCYDCLGRERFAAETARLRAGREERERRAT